MPKPKKIEVDVDFVELVVSCGTSIYIDDVDEKMSYFRSNKIKDIII